MGLVCNLYGPVLVRASSLPSALAQTELETYIFYQALHSASVASRHLEARLYDRTLTIPMQINNNAK